MYEKFAFSSEDDINFRWENITSESEFLSAYKNIVPMQFFFFFFDNRKENN